MFDEELSYNGFLLKPMLKGSSLIREIFDNQGCSQPSVGIDLGGQS